MDICSFGKSENFVRFLSFEYTSSLFDEMFFTLVGKGAFYLVPLGTSPPQLLLISF